MKILKYIWRNVKRNKIRSLLTILSISFSFAILTILYGYLAMQNAWPEEAKKNNRLVVMNVQGFSGKLPISYVDSVRKKEGVKAAVPFSWFGGQLGTEKMPFSQFATDASCVFQVWDEYTISPEQLKEWQNNKQGFVCDRRIAEKRKWQTGEKIVLQSPMLRTGLELVLCGTFDSPQYTDMVMFHWNYLDELQKGLNSPLAGNAGTIFVKIQDSDAIASTSQEIDKGFENSTNPTRTQTEAAFAQMFADMIGDIRMAFLYIGIAIVFSLSLVAANGMAMSTRERTTEIAVLKAIGFSKMHVLGMVIGEACIIAMLGGVFGIFMGCSCLEGLHNMSTQFIPLSILDFAGSWIVILIATAGFVGFASGIVPAGIASNLSVVDGLRRVV